jgi:WD repeat-containing protein 48
MLRVKKIYQFLGEKIHLGIDPACWYTGMGEPVLDKRLAQVELTCNEKVLDPRMTLATVKHFFWKSSGDVVIAYRSKIIS